MTVLRMSRVLRNDARANPDAIFLFGDNDMRAGYGGQAEELRGEPNAVGIRTKLTPSWDEGAYFTDAGFDRFTSMIRQDLEPVKRALACDPARIVVIPLDGLGTGRARMPRRAPRIFAFLVAELNALRGIGA